MDESLQHFGVKGMKWGVRKPQTPAQKEFLRRRRQRALRVGAGAVLVAGSAATAVALGRNGNLPVGLLQKASNRYSDEAAKAAQATVEAGRKAAIERFKALADATLADIADANASQDQFMRRQGLGHIVNRKE